MVDITRTEAAFGPPKFLKKINTYIYLRKSKNKHNFHLNRRIMLEIQTILQKILQIANVMSGY